MKKIVLVMAVMISAFAASAQKMATASAESLTKAKTAGVYVFAIPADVTAENVDAAKKYYTQYFATSFDQAKHEVKFTLTANEEMNRRVIQRFMSAIGVAEFKVGDKVLTYDEIFEQYMK